MLVDREFLADHRLALGDGARPRRLANLQHGGARGVGIGAPVHLTARRQHLRLVCFQVKIQVRQRVVLDVARRVPQLLELRQIGHRGSATGDEARATAGQRTLQTGVAQSAMSVFLERG